MNIHDSDSVPVFEPQPTDTIAVPDAVAQKTAALRKRLAKILAASGVKAASSDDGMPSHVTFGVDRLDQALRGNAIADGLPRAALHEFHSAEKEDSISAAAMVLLLAERSRRLDKVPKSILWISESGEARRQGRLYPPGLVELGVDPAAIIHIDAPDSIAALRSAADGVRSSAMGAIIIELSGRKPKGLDMTATRRLSLSAQKSGVPALLVRSGTARDDPLPSAAFSRWEVRAAPSVPLEANAPGDPAFEIVLLRHRSGLYGLSARLEWNRDYGAFRERQREERAPDTGTGLPLSADRADHKNTRAA